MPSRSPQTMIFHLEMVTRDALRPKAAPAGFEVVAVVPADPALNCRCYRQVGTAWNWTDRLNWSHDEWRRYVLRDELGTWLGRLDGELAGYFELESQAEGNTEIAYFGLLPEFIGRGLGGPLLSAAVQCAWKLPGARRVWVHTCTDDHEHALDNYRKRGFEVFKTEHVGQQV